jgi:hypothetical protein
MNVIISSVTDTQINLQVDIIGDTKYTGKNE